MVKARNGLTGSSMLLKALSNFAATTADGAREFLRFFQIFEETMEAP